MKLYTAKIQSELLNKAVLLTGAPRSGTTLLGKILSSLEGFEYYFEPPSLYMVSSLFAAGEISLSSASKILEVYLSEDLFLESIHGRAVNLRPYDDSQILNRLSWASLNERWNNISNRNDAIEFGRSNNLRLAIKMPNIFDSMALFENIIPNMKLLVSVRDGADVVRSIIVKGWVSNQGLERDLWPYSNNINNVNIPYWVPSEFHDRWPKMTEASRACLMWAKHAEMGLDALSKKSTNKITHKVRYEDLLVNPWPIVEEMAEVLESKITFFTKHWVESIRKPKSMKNSNRRDFESDTDKDILDYFNNINEKWGY